MYAGSDMETSHFPAILVENVIDVTGAGDAFVSATLYAWLNGDVISTAIQTGMLNASNTIRSSETVRTELSRNNLTNEMEEFIK